MKKLILTLLAAAGIQLTSASAQTITVGSGTSTSYLVIEAADFGATPLTFAYLYDYNPADPFDSYTMMAAIDTAVADLEFTYKNYGTPLEPNFILDAVTWQTVTLTNTPYPDFGPFWAQWVSGGQAGYPAAAPIASGVWGFGSGVSDPYRIVEPGSWDGFIFNDGSSAPSVTPVPEPGSAVLLIAGAGALFLRRRRLESSPDHRGTDSGRTR